MRGRSGTRGVAVIAVLALAVAGLLAPGASAALPRRTSSTQTLAPGLTLTRINTSEPMQIRVLTIDPARAVTVDLASAGSEFGSYARPSTIGANHNALAAVNGDFSMDGRPVHPFAEDGVLRSSGLQSGGAFAVSKDEAHVYLGAQALHMTGSDATAGTSFPVNSWNGGPPGNGEVSAFTSVGGSFERPPSDACSARLLSAGRLHWNPGRVGVFKDWTVDTVKCQSSPVTLGAGMVLSSKLTGAGADAIRSMKRGHTVRLSWNPGWSDVMDMIGGMPLLVSGGAVVARNDCGTYFCDRNPRTAIGTTADGRVLLVTVDGRATGVSLGMTLVGLAREMQSLGATWAVNLDGGGGSAMWVKGQGLVNRPSDGSERPVTNAILVLPGPDSGEPTPVGRVPVLSAAGAEDAAQLAAADPGSTGGLLEALLARELGATQPLPRAWADAARTFRVSQA
jgi:hypothetical protein